MTTVVEFYVPDKERKEAKRLLLEHFDKKYISDIEQGFYDYTEQYCKNNNSYLSMAKPIYCDIVKNVLYNCNQDNITIQKLKKDVHDGKFNPYNIAFLRPEELNEENWIKIILRRATTEDKINNMATVTWKACRDCKCTQYTFNQLQTRSADEPMTTFYTCKQCTRTYKLNN